MSSLSGTDTISSLAAAPTFDSSNSGPPPSIAPATFTFITNPSSLPSVPTATTLNSNPTSVAISKSSSSKVSAGVAIGIAAGVFAVLAIALVFFMSVRHKRKMARRPKGSRKSWNKLDDGPGSASGHAAPPGRKGAMADVPMRTVVEKHPASPRAPPSAAGGGGGDPVPFQNLKAQSDNEQPAPIIPGHPFSNLDSQTSSYYAKHPYAANMTTQASSQGANNNIPNPFVSRTPSNSSTFQSLYNTTSVDHDAYASTLSAFPAVQMALRLNSVASSTEYAEDKTPSPTQSHHPVISSTYLDVEHQRAPRESYESFYDQYDSLPQAQGNSHTISQSKSAAISTPSGRKAIQDIITALDGGKQHPTAWNDGNLNRGSTRLSSGEDIANPPKFNSLEQNHEGQMVGRAVQDPHFSTGNNVVLNPFRN